MMISLLPYTAKAVVTCDSLFTKPAAVSSLDSIVTTEFYVDTSSYEAQSTKPNAVEANKVQERL